MTRGADLSYCPWLPFLASMLLHWMGPSDVFACLAAMVEIMCGILTGLGFGVEPTGRHNDGTFMAVFNVEAFRPLKEFKKEVAEFARYLKDTPPSEGSKGVLYPGEIEYRTEQERRKSGIDVEDATWEKLRALAKDAKLSAELQL